jgi:U1 small nuclear ribonucleoprotein
MYGAIERVRIVRDQKDKSRGYAFIVYERERDMKGVSGGSLCRLLVSR